MRLAAIEDKLSKMNITEEEMKAYEKVAGLMGAGVPAATPQLSPQICTIARQRIVYCWRCIRPIITVCECQCGPCIESGGGGGGFTGGFGGFGG
ncbi:MAG: hypothetical protein ABI822_12085 [Bryobacteraceae bacterium]